jgi:hypothetical protein
MSRRASLRRASRDERGLVLPTRLMVFSISVVALAGLAFVATQSGDDTTDTVSPAAASQPTPTPTAGTTTITVTPTTSARPKPAVRRGKVYVEVYNNSNVKGLAGKTGTRAQRVGWNVVGTDNWYGTVDTSTVYYGPRLKAAASLLAKDLGIAKVKPAVAPMRFDRLTVILTGDYAD